MLLKCEPIDVVSVKGEAGAASLSPGPEKSTHSVLNQASGHNLEQKTAVPLT